MANSSASLSNIENMSQAEIHRLMQAQGLRRIPAGYGSSFHLYANDCFLQYSSPNLLEKASGFKLHLPIEIDQCDDMNKILIEMAKKYPHFSYKFAPQTQTYGSLLRQGFSQTEITDHMAFALGGSQYGKTVTVYLEEGLDTEQAITRFASELDARMKSANIKMIDSQKLGVHLSGGKVMEDSKMIDVAPERMVKGSDRIFYTYDGHTGSAYRAIEKPKGVNGYIDDYRYRNRIFPKNNPFDGVRVKPVNMAEASASYHNDPASHTSKTANSSRGQARSASQATKAKSVNAKPHTATADIKGLQTKSAWANWADGTIHYNGQVKPIPESVKTTYPKFLEGLKKQQAVVTLPLKGLNKTQIQEIQSFYQEQGVKMHISSDGQRLTTDIGEAPKLRKLRIDARMQASTGRAINWETGKMFVDGSYVDIPASVKKTAPSEITLNEGWHINPKGLNEAQLAEVKDFYAKCGVELTQGSNGSLIAKSGKINLNSLGYDAYMAQNPQARAQAGRTPHAGAETAHATSPEPPHASTGQGNATSSAKGKVIETKYEVGMPDTRLGYHTGPERVQTGNMRMAKGHVVDAEVVQASKMAKGATKLSKVGGTLAKTAGKAAVLTMFVDGETETLFRDPVKYATDMGEGFVELGKMGVKAVQHPVKAAHKAAELLSSADTYVGIKDWAAEGALKNGIALDGAIMNGLARIGLSDTTMKTHKDNTRTLVHREKDGTIDFTTHMTATGETISTTTYVAGAKKRTTYIDPKTKQTGKEVEYGPDGKPIDIVECYPGTQLVKEHYRKEVDKDTGKMTNKGTIEHFDETGRLESIDHYNGTRLVETAFYNANGQIVQRDHFHPSAEDSDDDARTTADIYDPQTGRVIEQHLYNDDGKHMGVRTGEEIEQPEEESQTKRERAKPFDERALSKDLNIEKVGAKETQTRCYEGTDQKAAVLFIDHADDESRVVEEFYDKNGRVIQRDVYDKEGDSVVNRTFYDPEKGEVIQQDEWDEPKGPDLPGVAKARSHLPKKTTMFVDGKPVEEITLDENNKEVRTSLVPEPQVTPEIEEQQPTPAEEQEEIPQETPRTREQNVHVYQEEARQQATSRLDKMERKRNYGGISLGGNNKTVALANIRKMEEAGYLPMGVDKDGKPVSNAEVYLYKMMQANALYSPNEAVTVKDENNVSHKVKMTEVMHGNHREVLKNLTTSEMSEEELKTASACVSSVEKTISSSGHANLNVHGVNGKYSYNQEKEAGFENTTITVPVEETAEQSGATPTAEQSGATPTAEQPGATPTAENAPTDSILENNGQADSSEQSSPAQRQTSYFNFSLPRELRSAQTPTNNGQANATEQSTPAQRQTSYFNFSLPRELRSAQTPTNNGQANATEQPTSAQTPTNNGQANATEQPTSAQTPTNNGQANATGQPTPTQASANSGQATNSSPNLISIFKGNAQGVPESQSQPDQPVDQHEH